MVLHPVDATTYDFVGNFLHFVKLNNIVNKGGFAPPALSTLSQFELLSVLGGPGAQAVRDCCRGRHGVVGVSGMGKNSRALGVIPGTLSPGGNPRHSDLTEP